MSPVAAGDAIHAVLCAADYNIRSLMRMIRKKGIRLFFHLIRMLGLGGLLTQKLISNRYAVLRRSQQIASMA
jgi:hypothetical protein